MNIKVIYIYRPLGYKRVYLQLYKVALTTFDVQGVEILVYTKLVNRTSSRKHFVNFTQFMFYSKGYK